MKPKVLKIKGLNSFLEEQKIDFSKLTEKGLFGIFGPTGSGKSSILDAMTLALYGEISRASKNDKGYINTNTNSAIVSLEFEIGEGIKRKTYVVERNIARDKHGAYKAKQVRLLEVQSEGIQVIAERGTDVNKEIENILGLTLEDFTRSVVLPQGKFSEFLKLTGVERRNMLERIFNLEKYGRELTEKVRRERNKSNIEENQLEGQLKAYEGVSEEACMTLDIEVNELAKAEEELKTQKVRMEEEFNKCKKVWELQGELNKHEKNMEMLEEKIPYHEKNKVVVKSGENANKVKGNIVLLSSTEEKVKENESTLGIKEKEMAILEEALKMHKEGFYTAEAQKNNKIPELIKKEVELNQVIKVMESIGKLKEERKIYATQWEELKKQTEEKKKEQNAISIKIDILKAEIQKNENTINNNKVDVAFRNKIQFALDVEKEYEGLHKDKKELEREIEIKTKVIEEQEKTGLRSEEAVKAKTVRLKVVNDASVALKSPGDYGMVNERQKSIIEDRNKLVILKEKIEEKKSLLKQLEEVRGFRGKKSIEEKSIEESFNKVKKEQEVLKEEIERIIEVNKASVLAKTLKDGQPCPVCGATDHIHLATEMDNAILNHKEVESKKIEAEIKVLDQKLNLLKIEGAKIATSEESLVTQLQGYKEIEVGLSVEELLQEVTLREKVVQDLEKRISLFERERNRLNLETLTLVSELGKLDSMNSALKSQLEGEQRNRKEKEEKLLEKQKVFEAKEKEYISIKEDLKINNLKEEMKEIQKKEKEVQNIEKANEAYKKDKEEKECKMEVLKNVVNGLLVQIQEVETLGKAIKEQMDEKQKECTEKYSGENIKLDLEEVQKNIVAIDRTYKETKEKYEGTNENLIEVSKKKEALIREKHVLENLKKEQLDRVNITLKENSFASIEEVKAAILEDSTLESMKIEIKDFEERIAITRSNVKTLKENLMGNRITEEQFNYLTENLTELNQTLEVKHDFVIKKTQSYKEMKEKLEVCKNLLDKKQKINEKLELVNQIEKLIMGNRFVEYVAKYQLKYIAKEASRELRKISRDRYGLEIDEESNFIIVDNYNGGERRSTTTLSGGETFLASLALALALSSQIQLKGSAPLEFFFLDEGFGTLDSELLDIVMSSLERLHHNRLSIGIISHVEELKQRIPVKLIVTPSRFGEGGTKVQID